MVPEGLGTALKPAMEPWVLARRPLDGTVARNVLTHGVGALHIDACRVGSDDPLVRPAIQRHDNDVLGKGLGAGVQVEPAGRWPANVIHDGSDEVLAGFPVTTSGVQTRPLGTGGIWTKGNGGDPCGPQYGDTGSAARFFYCAKASKRDRDEGVHPTVKPEALMAYLCRLITPPGGTVLDPFMGSGSTGKAAVRAGFGFVGIERDPAYFDIAVRRVRAALEDRT